MFLMADHRSVCDGRGPGIASQTRLLYQEGTRDGRGVWCGLHERGQTTLAGGRGGVSKERKKNIAGRLFLGQGSKDICSRDEGY